MTLRYVAVSRNGLSTITSSPHSTPMGAQFTRSSASTVVTMLSMIIEFDLVRQSGQSRTLRTAMLSVRLKPDTTYAVPLCLQYFAAPHAPVQIERIEDDVDRIGGTEKVLDDDLFLLEGFVVLEKPAEFAKDVNRKLLLVRDV